VLLHAIDRIHQQPARIPALPSGRRSSRPREVASHVEWLGCGFRSPRSAERYHAEQGARYRLSVPCIPQPARLSGAGRWRLPRSAVRSRRNGLDRRLLHHCLRRPPSSSVPCFLTTFRLTLQ
jgi:hypothetical protein